MAKRIIAIIDAFLALSASSPVLHEMLISSPMIVDFLHSTLHSSESTFAS